MFRTFGFRFPVWLCLLFALGGLTGCGESGSGTGVKIARDPSWFPVDFGGQETSIVAFSDELIEEIAQSEGFEVSFQSITWEQIPLVLKSGRADAVLSALPPIPEYRTAYDFSDTYLYIGPVLVVSSDSDAAALEDMRGKIVGVLGGSSGMLMVAKVPDIVLRDYMNVGLALEELLRGQVDGVVMAALPAYAYMRDFYSGRLKVVTPPLTDAGLRLLVRKGEHEDLLKQFDRGLKAMRADGTYNELQEKWRLNLHEGPAREPFVTTSPD